MTFYVHLLAFGAAVLLAVPACGRTAGSQRDCTDHFTDGESHWTVSDRGANWYTISPSKAQLTAMIPFSGTNREKFAAEGFFANGTDASILLHPAHTLSKAGLWVEVHGRQTFLPPIRVRRRAGEFLPVQLRAKQIAPLLVEGGLLVFTFYDGKSRLVDRVGLQPELLQLALARLQTMAANYSKRLADPERYCPIPDIIIAN